MEKKPVAPGELPFNVGSSIGVKGGTVALDSLLGGCVEGVDRARRWLIINPDGDVTISGFASGTFGDEGGLGKPELGTTGVGGVIVVTGVAGGDSV